MRFWDAVTSTGPHMQTICTLLQTDYHTNTSSLNFYRLDALPNAQPTVSKHWSYDVIHRHTLTLCITVEQFHEQTLIMQMLIVCDFSKQI